MVPWRATEEGFVTPQVLGWYRRFAQGQPGAIVLEATGIRDVPSGPLLRIGHERFVPGLREVAETVHEASQGRTRVLIQLIDFLAIRRRPAKDKFFGRFLKLEGRHQAALAQRDPGLRGAGEEELRAALAALPDEDLKRILSNREWRDYSVGYRESVNDLQLEQIRDLPRVLPTLFADAAERAREAGFDGVELHYAHAYTMASFLSRRNVRSDGYGGNRDSRARLPLEVYEAVRARVGSDFVVGCRFLADEVIEGGSRVDDACDYAERFAAAGMDFVSLSKGGKFEDARQPRVGEAAYPYTGRSGHECMPTVRSDARGPFGRNVELAARVRAHLRAAGQETPVVTAGGIGTFELAERILAEGSADIIGMARASLAEPDWTRLVREGRGDEIRRCVYTNYCEGLDQKHKEVTCQLWDRVDLDQAGPQLSKDGKRRLLAP
jgi:2,4-dienoyl-CoA reductase-like NADH-dependent reductase (Old Yellow Enzyme family)